MFYFITVSFFRKDKKKWYFWKKQIYIHFIFFSVYLFANIKYNTNYNNNKTFGSSPGSNLLI